MFRKSKSFTLIELLVVIFIIGVLAALITSNVSRSRMKGRDARRKADLNSIRTAVETYAMENGTMPGNCGTTACCSNDSTCGSTWATLETVLQPYLYPLPKDPINNSNYRYKYTNSNTDYKVSALLELSGDPDAANDGGASTSYYELFTLGARSWSP
jgi:general secretion pathway protein G